MRIVRLMLLVILTLALWGVVSFALALRFFRWS